MTEQERARNRERNLRAMKRYPQYWLTNRQNEFLRKLRSGDYTRVEDIRKAMELEFSTLDRWLRQPMFVHFYMKAQAELMRRHEANEVLLLSNVTQIVHQATSNPDKPIGDGVVKLTLEAMRRIKPLKQSISPPKREKLPALVHPSVPKEDRDSIFKDLRDDN